MNDDFQQRKEAILQHTTITSIASRYNAIKRIGSEHVTICPAHDDTKPSLTIYTGKDGKERAKCFACGYSASNAIDLYMQITGRDYPEAIEDLSEGLLQGASDKPVSIDAPILKPAEWEVSKPPSGAMPRMTHYEFGEPVDYWVFKDATGDPLFYELRYEVIDPNSGEIKKEPRPMTWGRHSKHLPYKWSFRAWPAPRPLFGLNHLAKFPSIASVVFFEGPRKAELAQKLLKVPCMSWSGGANAWTYCDLEPLRGRKVILFPDNDDKGIRAMQLLAVRLINDYECTCEVVNVPIDKPEKWDICDEPNLTASTLKTWLKDRSFVVAERTVEVIEQMTSDAISKAQGKPAKAKMRYIHDPTKTYNDATGTIGCGSQDDDTDSTSSAATGTSSTSATVININPDRVTLEGWGEPENITKVCEPTYIDRSYLPSLIADFAFSSAPSLGGDPGSLAMAMLTTVASAIDDRIKVQPDRYSRWGESARIWTCLIGPPSSKKSPTINKATSHLKKLDLKQEALNGKGKSAYKALQKAYDKSMAEWADKVAQGDTGAVMPEPPTKPNVVRHYANDILIEVFGEICALNPRGMLIELDELASWVNSMSKYSAGGGSDRAAWLSAFNGGTMRVDRMSRQLAIDNFSCSVLSACQPQVLKTIADSNEDGLLQRFVMVFVPPAIEPISPTYAQAQAINAAEQRYNELIDWLVGMRDPQCTVIMSDRARDMHKALFRECHEAAIVDAWGPSCSAALEKYEGYIARFALIYHCIECFERGILPDNMEVSAETMEKVCQLFGKFIIPNAIYFYNNILGSNSGGSTTSDIEGVARMLLAYDYHVVNAAIIRRNVTSLRKSSIQHRKEVLTQLSEANWIRPDVRGRKDLVTGMPKNWEVNPLIWERYAQDRIKEQRRLAVVKKHMKEDRFGQDYRREQEAIASRQQQAEQQEGKQANG